MTDQRIAEITAHADNFIGGGTEQDWAADIYFLLAGIDRLTEAQRWIPVSEKPRRTQNCLCLFNDGSMAIAWYNGIPYEFHPDITHWMPLPAAPKGE